MLQVILLLLCLLTTAVSGWRGISAFKERKIQRATRLFGWALLPVGAYLAGLVTLVSRLGSALSKWVLNLVFNPITWTGLIILAVAVALLLASGFRVRRDSDSSTSAADPTVDSTFV